MQIDPETNHLLLFEHAGSHFQKTSGFWDLEPNAVRHESNAQGPIQIPGWIRKPILIRSHVRFQSPVPAAMLDLGNNHCLALELSLYRVMPLRVSSTTYTRNN